MQVKDAIEFIRIHDPRGKFKLWSDESLCFAIHESIKKQCFLWYGDHNGLGGIAFGHWTDASTIHVELFVSKKGKTRHFIKWLLMLHPNVKIVGNRNGRLKDLTRILKYYGRSKS